MRAMTAVRGALVEEQEAQRARAERRLVRNSGTGGAAGTGGQDAGDGGDADAGAADSGGNDGGDAETEPYCDPTSLPGDDPCVIHDDHGIFVSPNGSDGAGCGTMASPCATLTEGMTHAKSEGKRVLRVRGWRRLPREPDHRHVPR